MNLDCYDYYLWSLGELRLSPKLNQQLNNPLEGDEDNEQ